jgi:hypothetical protein
MFEVPRVAAKHRVPQGIGYEVGKKGEAYENFCFTQRFHVNVISANGFYQYTKFSEILKVMRTPFTRNSDQ